MSNKQMSFFDPSADLAVEADRAEFERIEAAALTTRAQTVATLSTFAQMIGQTATPPLSKIDPYTAGLMAIGHVIDSLKLLDIEDSNLTVQGLVEKVSNDIARQFEILKAGNEIEVMPWRSEIEAWGKNIVEKLLCKKGMGKNTDRLFNSESGEYYDFQHSLLEERENPNGRGGIFVKPTTACLTLYLGTLTQTIGDAQAAFAAVIQRQIRRGEYHAALQSAIEHQRVTKQYCVEIQKFRRKILADASRQGWSSDVLPLIEKTQDEVDDAMTSVTELDTHLEESFDLLPRDKQVLAEKVLKVIRQSRTAYRELQAVMIQLPLLYHQCIASQGFISKHIKVPAMREEVFLPLFYEVTDKEQFEKACEIIFVACMAPEAHFLYDPIAATEVLLRSPSQGETRDDSEKEEYLDEDQICISMFTPDTIKKARQALQGIVEPTLLSKLAKELCAEAFYEEAICVALLVTNAWVHGKLVEEELRPTRAYQSYRCDACHGDDYLISREGI